MALDTTFGGIKAAIADDIDDTTDEYAAQIETAVLGAIRYCERFTFYFNEARPQDKTFSTVSGQQWYSSSDLADIATLVRIQRAYFVDTGGQITDLIQLPPEEMEVLSDNTAATGQPYGYTYFARQIRLYPIPNAVYTIRLQLGPYRLTALSAGTNTNVWLTEAFDMIKARAKYLVYKDTIKDPGLAAEALNDFIDQKAELKAETSSRNGTGRIRPTSF